MSRGTVLKICFMFGWIFVFRAFLLMSLASCPEMMFVFIRISSDLSRVDEYTVITYFCATNRNGNRISIRHVYLI